jgi:hypothetical protein
MSCLGKVVQIMMLLLLVRLLLLVLVLVAIMLTSATPLPHLLWSLPYLLWPQLLMSSMRASPVMRSLCWRVSSVPYTSSARRGGDHLGVASCSATPSTADCPKRKKLDSSNKYDYIKQNGYSKGDDKKKHRFEDKKKKKFQKIMSRACAALSDFDFFSDSSSSSDEDEKVKRK